jgi:hypothetical protein
LLALSPLALAVLLIAILLRNCASIGSPG